MKKIVISTVACSLALLSPTFAQAPKPAPADCFGIVEIGAKGVKAVALANQGRDSSGKLLPPKLLKAYDPVNKDAYKGETAKNVSEELLKFNSTMTEAWNIPPGNFFVVKSSGVPEDVKTALQNKLPEGVVPDQITVEQESRLVFKGIVPPNRMKVNEVVVLDIGSGNSKGAYLNPDGTDGFSTFSINYGTGTFSKKIASVYQNGDDYQALAIRIAAEELLPLLRSEVSKSPGMLKCSRLYLAGGLPYVMTTLLHPERIGSKDPEDPTGKKTSDWVKLSAKDVNEFHRIATTNPTSLFSPDLAMFSGKDLENATKEVERASKIFTKDELTAGAILLKMFMDEMKFAEKDAIFFSRQALYAWPQGYVKEKMEAR